MPLHQPASEHQRTLRRRQPVPQHTQVFSGRFGAHLRLRQHRPSRRRGQHVLRQGDHHRTGRARGGDLERAQQGFGGSRGIGNLGRPLGNPSEHATIVDLLEGVASHIAGVLLGGVDRDRRVAGARTAADAGDARPAGQPRVGQGHEAGAGLMPANHRVDLRPAVQGIQQAKVALAGDAEQPVDPVRDQGIYDQIADTPGCRGHTRQECALAAWIEFHVSPNRPVANDLQRRSAAEPVQRKAYQL